MTDVNGGDGEAGMVYKCAHDSRGSDAPCAFGCNYIEYPEPTVRPPQDLDCLVAVETWLAHRAAPRHILDAMAEIRALVKQLGGVA